MSCTSEDIERKRKIALEKLQARKLQKLHENIITNSPNQPGQVFRNCLTECTDNYQIEKQNFNHKGTFSPKLKEKSPYSSYNSSPNTSDKINLNQFFGKGNITTGTCYLINESRFEVNMSGFSLGAIEVFKSMRSRSYKPETKLWNFSIDEYESLMSKISQLSDVVIGRIPYYALNICRIKKSEDNEYDLSKIEPELRNSLMPFQEEGVYFGISNGGRCFIADEMGLGKTFQALAIASYYREDWPLLISTTSSMRYTWEETIHKYLPSVPVPYVQFMLSRKEYVTDAQILIVSHDMMTHCTEKLLERKYGVLIFDESHALKNFKAKCTQSASALAKVAKRVILLSGTPALSRPSELYTQLSLIDDRFFGSFMDYSKRYCDGKSSPFGWVSTGKSNLQELEIVLSKKFMIRRTKADVLQCLPERTREVIKLDVGLNQLSEGERLCLNTLVDNFMAKKAREKHVALLSLFSETSRIKVPAVCVYIEQLIKENRKFLVFAHHQVMLDAICKVLNKHSKKFIRIDGATNSDQRKFFINKFQTDDTYLCAVLSTLAANAGITMTAAQLVVFAELHWNPSILTQAESRAHRIGQLGTVTVQYLIADGTADDHIWPILLSKQDVLNEAGLNKDSFKGSAVFSQYIEGCQDITSSGTKNIEDYFVKQKAEENTDEVMQRFLADDDDDIFLHVNFDN